MEMISYHRKIKHPNFKSRGKEKEKSSNSRALEEKDCANEGWIAKPKEEENCINTL